MTEEDVEQQRHFRQEREARSLALEKAYVHDVYSQIAPYFARHRSKAWPRVCHFLLDLEPGSLVCDVGCGNGKYLDTNPEIFKLGSDRCRQLAETARQQRHELVVCDNLHLPFRDESFDAALSVAVIHHLATTERRVQALRELARILRLGGRLIISVWAMERRHRRFESQDVLVPWHKPVESSSEEQGSHADGEVTSTTTSDDDLLNYHAHSQLDSDSCSMPSRCGRRRHRLRTSRGHCRGLEGPCPSSSQSSSDLSSPNETCYSFVRRALAKFSTRRSWEDHRHRCRPWFVPSPPSTHHSPTNHLETQGSGESTENAADLPIELRDVDTPPSEPDTPLTSPRGPKPNTHQCLNQKSKSLSDLLTLLTAGFLRGQNNKKGPETPSDKKVLQGLGRSKSSHTHLTSVEENSDDPIEPKPKPKPTTNRDFEPQGRRPRSLIILNAEDRKNGNTILPDVEAEVAAISKRASWPVAPARLSILKGDFPPLDVRGESLADSGVEDLNNGGGDELPAMKTLPASVGSKGYSHHPPVRLKRQLVKQVENIDFPDSGELRDVLWESVVRQMVTQAKLFPSHSMPDLNAPSSRIFFTTKAMTVAPLLFRNGYKARFRRKDSGTVTGGLPNGYCVVKRSVSLDNAGCNERAFEPRERVYCNRITKEDSLQRDTSYDSDDSVASVIAVPRAVASDTSLDSEGSCISVIAMPSKETALPPPPDVLQVSTPATTPQAPDVVHPGLALSPDRTEEGQDISPCLPDLVCGGPIHEISPPEVDPMTIQVPRITMAEDDDCLVGALGDPSLDERKMLRKAGSLPEQGGEVAGGLLSQPAVALSASADLTSGSNSKTINVGDWRSLSGSLSSSRSSSNSSISWEKFLDASRSVVLDNIAVVSTGSDLPSSRNAAFLKNGPRKQQHNTISNEDKPEVDPAKDSPSSDRGTPSPLLQAAAEVANSLRGAVSMAVSSSETKTDNNKFEEPTPHTTLDVELKEAGVQTSLILYSNNPFEEPSEPPPRSPQPKLPPPPRSSSHEDALNGNLPVLEEGSTKEGNESESKCLNCQRSLSTSDESLQCSGEVGGALTFHRYYHVFREGELDHLIEKYVENLHIISSYYDHANWCIIAEKVQVWRI